MSETARGWHEHIADAAHFEDGKRFAIVRINEDGSCTQTGLYGRKATAFQQQTRQANEELYGDTLRAVYVVADCPTSRTVYTSRYATLCNIPKVERSGMNETTLGQFLCDHLDGVYMPVYTLDKCGVFDMYARLHHRRRDVATRVTWTWVQGDTLTCKAVTDASDGTALFNYYPTDEELQQADLAENGPE